MNQRSITSLTGGVVACVLAMTCSNHISAAVFKSPREQVLFFNGSAGGSTVAARDGGSTKEVSAVWGELPDGRAVGTIRQHPHLGHDDVEGHSHGTAGPVALIASNGSSTVLKGIPEALRVFLSPSGNALAVITPDRDLVLCSTTDAFASITTRSVTINGRVSHASWSPDSSRVAAAVYPPDFSPEKADNPRNPDEFIRLQNADVYLVDAATGSVERQVTDSPGTDYSPFFSPDGKHLYYIWLHELENQGGLMRVPVAEEDAESSPVQVTRAGAETGQVPLGRVGTYLFPDEQTLIFEAGRPDGSGEIWRMRRDGTSARMVTPGRYPQQTSDGSIAVLAGDKPVTISKEELAR